MARLVEFDVSKAQDKALVLFWRKGYQATSLADLLEAMGIGRSSFYAAFGDKRSLFLACLDLFGARTQGILLRTRSDIPPLDLLQNFFERQFVGSGAARAQWGCMLVNTITASDRHTLFSSGQSLSMGTSLSQVFWVLP